MAVMPIIGAEALGLFPTEISAFMNRSVEKSEKGHNFRKNVFPVAKGRYDGAEPPLYFPSMGTDSTHDVTRLLQAWSDGSPQASEQLLPLIYEHLRGLARENMRHERGGHTLQPTALVHEVYLRLVGSASVQYQGRTHFYSLAARAMRRILVDHARARHALRRGGGASRVSLSEVATVAQPEGNNQEMDLVALDTALLRLTDDHPRMGRVVELRFFGEMEMADIAEVLQVTERTVKRDWQFAKLWLRRELGPRLANSLVVEPTKHNP